MVEFFGYLDTKKLMTKVTYVNPTTHKTYFGSIDMKKFLTEKLGLLDSGKNVEELEHNHYLAEFRWYSNERRVKFLAKETSDGKIKMETIKFTSSIKSMYKELCDLVTKMMMSHTGNVSTGIWPKLRALAALTDEVAKTEQYNWYQFIIDQLVETSKSVSPVSDISFMVSMKKIHFARLIPISRKRVTLDYRR